MSGSVYVGRPMDRLASKIDFSGECWRWTDHLAAGYGKFLLDGKMQPAHRAVWKMVVGPIPEGLTLDHLCRNPSCVNPDHLEPVTLRENILRGVGASATHAAKTHCKHGHPFNLENTRVTPSGGRVCRACHRESENKRYADFKRRWEQKAPTGPIRLGWRAR